MGSGERGADDGPSLSPSFPHPLVHRGRSLPGAHPSLHSPKARTPPVYAGFARNDCGSALSHSPIPQCQGSSWNRHTCMHTHMYTHSLTHTHTCKCLLGKQGCHLRRGLRTAVWFAAQGANKGAGQPLLCRWPTSWEKATSPTWHLLTTSTHRPTDGGPPGPWPRRPPALLPPPSPPPNAADRGDQCKSQLQTSPPQRLRHQFL